MSVLVVTGIGLLVTHDPERGEVEGAAIVCEGGRVAWTGPESALPEQAGSGRLDVGGACVVPGFVDAHTHLVFAGDRAGEFTARLAGAPYEAGGIRATVAATRAASRERLRANARRLAAEALAGGTTTMEVKSGYGLTVADERRLLEVAGTLPAVVPTFLGAHVVPAEYEGRADAYVDLVCGPMLDACAPLAQWCDVFCEDGAFDEDQARAVLEAGAARGLGLRVHANQLAEGAGARLAAEVGAA
ncbi:MAG: imidazolonepropionase, partial [Egibacteraceae bacterium]